MSLADDIRDWSGSWPGKMSERCVDTWADELGHYPPESVAKALRSARVDFEREFPGRASHPSLGFVLARLPESQAPRLVPSTVDFSNARGLMLDGPAWDDPEKLETNRATLQKWAAHMAQCGMWDVLAHESVLAALARFGVDVPGKAQPRQHELTEGTG